jgi:hypothetical protein
VPVRVVWAILVGGALCGLLATPHRLADASSFVLMTDSLLHDGDLRYERRDLARARALRFDDVPAGLMLVKDANGDYAYGKPALYPVAALPWYALFGVRGFLGMNGFLLGALVVLGADLLAPMLGWRSAVVVAADVYALSVVPTYVHWIDPFLALCVLVAGGLAAHRRGRPVLAGAAFAAAAMYRFPYALLLAVPLVAHLRAGRGGDAARVAAGAVAAALVMATFTYASIGQWSAYTGDRYHYENVFPFETTTAEVGRPSSRDDVLEHWRLPAPSDVAAGLADFVVGRAAGVLLYFPSFFVCLLWMRRWDVERIGWLVAVGGFALVLELMVPHNRVGGSYALGNRFFVLLPLAFGLIHDGGWSRWRLAGSAALAVLAAPLVVTPGPGVLAPGRTLVAWPQRAFPFEWSLAEHVTYPATFPGLFALTDNQYDWEPASGKVWTVGGTRAEFVLVRPDGAPPRVNLISLLPEARVVDGGVGYTVRFDGGPQQITLSHPRTVYRNEYGGAETAVYHLEIETDQAVVPSAAGLNADGRPLGVAVQPVS